VTELGAEEAVAEAREPVFHRILLKLSGEALMGPREYGIDLPTVEAIAAEIVDVHERGVEVAIVIGAGRRSSSRRSRSRRSPSRTSAAGRSATSRGTGSSSSRPAPATRSSPPILRPRCGRSRSAPMRS
jgi:hypothetical protein